MFQAFIVICFVGAEPSFDNCEAQLQPFIWPDEKTCQSQLFQYTQEILENPFYLEMEVMDLGCHNYLDFMRPKPNL